MSLSSDNITRLPYGKGARNVTLQVDGGTHIYQGSMVAQLDSTSMLVPGSTPSSGPCIGVSAHEQDASNFSDGEKSCDVETDAIFVFANAAAPHACSEATSFGTLVYMQDDVTISADSNTGAYKAAGYFAGMEPDGQVRVFISMRRTDVAPLESDLSATTGAGLVGIADGGGFTSATDVESALEELYQHNASIQKQVNIPILSALDAATGALLAVFADGASTTPGTQLSNSKAACVRWNNHATPGAIAITVPMPQDLDDTADVVFHALVSKTGATVGDATKLTIGAFEQVVGAAHDADTDFGGDTGAVVGNAASKTVTELTRTLALADIHATPSAITFTIKPKDGTLGTDDLHLHACWLEYKGKLLTA